MKKSFQRVVCVSLAVLIATAFPACKKKEKEFKPSFAIKNYADEDIAFAIPDAWGEVADPSGSGVLVFAGKEAYEDGGFNNVSVCVYDTENPAPVLEDVKAAFQEGFEAKVKESYPEAADFSYDDFEAAGRPVFTAQYRVTVMEKELTQKVFYPLVDNKQIYVAACDNGGEGISAQEAAEEIVHTLRVGSDEEASKPE